MSYIERDIFINNELIPLVKTLELCHPKQKKGVLMAISKLKEAPGADVVEVGRGKDCKHAILDLMEKGLAVCRRPVLKNGQLLPFNWENKYNDFCSYGERKDGE